MRDEERLTIQQQLETIPPGHLKVIHHPSSGHPSPLFTDQFQAQTKGKGRIEVYPLFPGVEASYHTFLAPEVLFQHASSPAVLELFYCRSGRIGWNMQGNTAIYLGAGNLTVHSAACCAHSAMMFSLGYVEGLSISIDLQSFGMALPDILQEAELNVETLQSTFCAGRPVAIPSCPALDGLFHPLYTVSPSLRTPYLKLKVQELLLYLQEFPIGGNELTQYFSQQTELIQEIHNLLTEHLDQRFTIEDLSKRYLINTSTLKAVFKTVYGLPIATYMKEFRVRQAMKLLRETNDSIATIAAQVGYGSQGKFTKAFKDVTQLLPTEYRKYCRSNGIHGH